MLRDDDDDYKATWTKSTDGGATWTALATSTEYYNIGVGTPPDAASPFQIAKIGNRVYGFTCAREPVGVYYTYCCSADDFVADPASLWNHATSPNIVSTGSVTPSGQNYLNAGYGSIIPIDGHEYTALLAYYTPDTDGSTSTNITIQTAVRV